MLWRRGEIIVFDDAPFTGVPSDTRSCILGDPTNGNTSVGCVVDLIDQTVFRPGSSGPARIGLVASELAETLQAPVNIWWGGVIGRVLTITTDDH